MLAIVPYDRVRHGDHPWRIVAAVFAEYGFEFAVNDYDRDLLEPDVHYAGEGRGFAVAEADGAPVGCVGITHEGGGRYELHRLYVLASARRCGAGEALVRWVLDAATRAGGREVVLYSDVAFRDAHRLYERLGFRCVTFRYAPDPWQSREWGYRLTLPHQPEHGGGPG